MKILLLLFLFIFGCEEIHPFVELENRLYELEEIYVFIGKDELHEKFNIDENDYKEVISLKTLILYEQKEIFIFDQASDSLKYKIDLMNKDNNVVLEIDHYVYYGVNDPIIIKIVEDSLNKQHQSDA